jgi:hypothetical protein
MKLVLREVFNRCTLAPASTRPESTRRRAITISPALGGRVVLHARDRGSRERQAALTAAA